VRLKPLQQRLQKQPLYYFSTPCSDPQVYRNNRNCKFSTCYPALKGVQIRRQDLGGHATALDRNSVPRQDTPCGYHVEIFHNEQLIPMFQVSGRAYEAAYTLIELEF
jgi:hypothetical protein